MPDPTYGPKVYRKQGGDELIVASGGVINVESGGAFKLAGTQVTASAAELNLNHGQTASPAEVNLLDGLPANVTMTPAAGAANVAEVTLQFKDAAGANMTKACEFDIWLSDSAAGVGLTSHASDAFAVKAASGEAFATLTDKKALRVQSKADGTAVVQITDSHKTLYVVCVRHAAWLQPATVTLIAGNYGA